MFPHSSSLLHHPKRSFLVPLKANLSVHTKRCSGVRLQPRNVTSANVVKLRKCRIFYSRGPVKVILEEDQVAGLEEQSGISTLPQITRSSHS